MPDRERVQAFIDTVVSGDHVKAIEDFYHADASMRENAREPRRGRDLLMAHEAGALRRLGIDHMVTHPVRTFLIDGDHVVIHWTFDLVDRQGVTRRMEELALQRWQGDRVAEERFFYDPASIQPVAGS